MPRSNLLVVRQWVQSGPVKTPRVPAGWTVIPECSGFASLYPNGRPGAVIHSVCAAVSGANGLFVLFGPRVALDKIAALVTNSWPSVAALRADTGAVAQQVKAVWIDERNEAQVAANAPLVALRSRMAGFLVDDGEAAIP